MNTIGRYAYTLLCPDDPRNWVDVPPRVAYLLNRSNEEPYLQNTLFSEMVYLSPEQAADSDRWNIKLFSIMPCFVFAAVTASASVAYAGHWVWTVLSAGCCVTGTGCGVRYLYSCQDSPPPVEIDV